MSKTGECPATGCGQDFVSKLLELFKILILLFFNSNFAFSIFITLLPRLEPMAR